MKDFKALGIKEGFIKGLEELRIKVPSSIQAEVIPLLLKSKTDFIGQAQTGTGKTAAYGLPILQRVNPEKDEIQALILCPTRELSQQVAKQLFRFTKYSEKIFTEAVFGGAPIDKQISSLTRPTQIVVATPGRLIDLINRKAINLKGVKFVVLDEADEMLSMGFKKELDEILSGLPEKRNTWLFSATLPTPIKQIIKTHMSPDADKIEVSKKDVVNKKINHQYLVCEPEDKLSILMQLLKAEKDNQGLIFCRTKAETKNLQQNLIEKKFSADAIHGDLLQKERDKVMRAFKNKKLKILIATDIAARGIDIEGLSYVVHYQLPEQDEYYTHRSGRTARAGKSGYSLCIVAHKDVKQIRHYEKELNIKFQQIRES